MDYRCVICSIFVLFGILRVNGQGFGQNVSPFGQAFGGNVFVPQNFPRPLDQTIDLERQGTFSISPPDGTGGVQLLETTISDGNRIIFQEGGQQGAQTGQGQSFGQQGFGGNAPQGQTTIIRQGAGGLPNSNIQFLQTGGGFGNPFPGLQLPAATLMPPVANANTFIGGPPNTVTGRLVNTIVGGNFPINALPTAIPNSQVNLVPGQQIGTIPPNQAFGGSQFQSAQGGQQFQANTASGNPNNQDNMANAVNAITGSNSFDQRFNLIDPTTNNAVGDLSNTDLQNQQFQVNQGFQQTQGNLFQQQGNQFQNQAQFTQGSQMNQFPRGGFQTDRFLNTGQNMQFNNFDQSQPQFLGNQGQFGNAPRSSEFENSNDIQSNRNFGQNNQFNFSSTHSMDPSVGVFRTDSFVNSLPQHATSIFTKFGLRGFEDVFPGELKPTPLTITTLNPGITFTPTMAPTLQPSTTSVPEYSCQHSECPKGQGCVYVEKYRCPKWIPMLKCKCMAGCMYNDWFIRKNFVIPVDRCGNHCACERDDGVATCTQIRCPNSP